MHSNRPGLISQSISSHLFGFEDKAIVGDFVDAQFRKAFLLRLPDSFVREILISQSLTNPSICGLIR